MPLYVYRRIFDTLITEYQVGKIIERIKERVRHNTRYIESFMIQPLLSFCWSSISSLSSLYNFGKGKLLSRSILNFLTSRGTSFKGSNKIFEIFAITVAISKRLGIKFIQINHAVNYLNYMHSFLFLQQSFKIIR